MLLKENKEVKLMDKDTVVKYGPVAIVVLAIIFQWNLFVTPEKLESKHRLIMEEVAKNYVTKEENKSQKEELRDMKTKIDKIYDLLINQKR